MARKISADKRAQLDLPSIRSDLIDPFSALRAAPDRCCHGDLGALRREKAEREIPNAVDRVAKFLRLAGAEINKKWSDQVDSKIRTVRTKWRNELHCADEVGKVVIGNSPAAQFLQDYLRTLMASEAHEVAVGYLTQSHFDRLQTAAELTHEAFFAGELRPLQRFSIERTDAIREVAREMAAVACKDRTFQRYTPSPMAERAQGLAFAALPPGMQEQVQFLIGSVAAVEEAVLLMRAPEALLTAEHGEVVTFTESYLAGRLSRAICCAFFRELSRREVPVADTVQVARGLYRALFEVPGLYKLSTETRQDLEMAAQILREFEQVARDFTCYSRWHDTVKAVAALGTAVRQPGAGAASPAHSTTALKDGAGIRLPSNLVRLLFIHHDPVREFPVACLNIDCASQNEFLFLPHPHPSGGELLMAESPDKLWKLCLENSVYLARNSARRLAVTETSSDLPLDDGSELRSELKSASRAYDFMQSRFAALVNQYPQISLFLSAADSVVVVHGRDAVRVGIPAECEEEILTVEAEGSGWRKADALLFDGTPWTMTQSLAVFELPLHTAETAPAAVDPRPEARPDTERTVKFPETVTFRTLYAILRRTGAELHTNPGGNGHQHYFERGSHRSHISSGFMGDDTILRRKFFEVARDLKVPEDVLRQAIEDQLGSRVREGRLH